MATEMQESPASAANTLYRSHGVSYQEPKEFMPGAMYSQAGVATEEQAAGVDLASVGNAEELMERVDAPPPPAPGPEQAETAQEPPRAEPEAAAYVPIPQHERNWMYNLQGWRLYAAMTGGYALVGAVLGYSHARKAEEFFRNMRT